MKTIIRGQTIEVNDDESLMVVCDEIARDKVKAIPPNLQTKALRTIIANLQYWLVKNGAQLTAASAFAYSGITLGAGKDSHDFIARLVGEQELLLPEPQPEEKRVIVEDETGSENDALEGDDGKVAYARRERDQLGRPIPPGQLDIDNIPEGAEL